MENSIREELETLKQVLLSKIEYEQDRAKHSTMKQFQRIHEEKARAY